jgi:hypothetical protein
MKTENKKNTKKGIIILLLLLFITVLLTLYGCQLDDFKFIKQDNSDLNHSELNEIDNHINNSKNLLDENNREEELNLKYQEILDSYQNVLLELTEVYLFLDKSHINFFLRNPNAKIDEIPNFYNQTQLEIIRVQVGLIDSNAELENLRYELDKKEKENQLFNFVDEFALFVNAQYEDYFHLEEIAKKKYLDNDPRDQEPGVYGAHHMYQVKNKQIAEQIVLLLDKYDELNYNNFSLEEKKGYEVQISEMLVILENHLYKNIGWP